MAEGCDPAILFAAESTELTADLVDDLPEAPLWVVVDDAHSRDDLGPLLAYVRRAQSEIKLVISARPQGQARIVAACGNAGFDSTEIVRASALPPLSETEMTRLASELLDGDDEARAVDLARAAGSSPLLCVVGAELLGQEEVSGAELRRSATFRDAVLSRFSEELVGRLGGTLDETFARRLLALIAAVGPVSVEADLLSKFGDVLNCDVAEVRRAIGVLEEAGLLESRGRLRRVIPDVLADRVLSDTALDADGRSTGWVDDLYERLGDHVLERLLTNVALVDWQVHGGQTGLLDVVWQRLQVRFDGCGAFARDQLLRSLRRVAVLQPRPALELARHAIAAETPPEEYSSVTGFTIDQGDVDRAAVGLLGGVAQHAAYVEQVFPVLWSLVPRDRRARTDGSDPYEQLKKLGTYGPGGHPEALLRFVESLVRFDAPGDDASPAIGLLRPLLAREIEWLRADSPARLTSTATYVHADLTMPLRRRVRDLLVARATDGTTRERMLAVELLTDGMRQPFGLYGRTVSEEELDSWEPDQAELITALEQVFEHTNDPVMRNRIRQGVAWHSDHSRWSEVAARSRAIVDAGASLDERVLSELAGGFRPGDSWERRAARQKSVAAELGAGMANGSQLAEYLDRLFGLAAIAGGDSRGSLFVAAVATDRPEFCADAVDWVIERESTSLDASVHLLLLGLRVVDRDAATVRAYKLAGAKGVRRRSAVAYVSGSGPLTDPSREEQQLLEQLLTDSDDGVRSEAAVALMILARDGEDRAYAKQLLLTFVPGRDTTSAEHLATAIIDFGLQRFSKHERHVLVNRFIEPRRLGYHSQELLHQVGESDPPAVLAVLVRRLRAHTDDERYSRFEALPDEALGPRLLSGAKSPKEYRALVRQLRDAYPQLSGSARFTLANSFWDVVVEPWVALDVLSEWLLSGEAERRKDAADLIGEMPWRELFRLAYPIAQLVERLTLHDAAVAARVTRALHGAALSGSWSRSHGHPAERDIETRIDALEVAQRVSILPSAAELYRGIAHSSEARAENDLQADDEGEMLFGT
jgi:hypothetical protein